MKIIQANRPAVAGAEPNLKRPSHSLRRRAISRSAKTKMQPNQIDSERVTIKQGAEFLGVHPNTIRNLILRQELAAERIGARIIRIRKQDLLNLLTPYEGGEFGVWK